MTTGRTSDHQPEQLFQQLVPRFLADPAVREGTGFGSSPGLRVGTKIFAMLIGGELVVKLPRERVDELIASGTGARLEMGHGRQMKEWATIPVRHRQDWEPLASEALEFVKRNGGSATRIRDSQEGCAATDRTRGVRSTAPGSGGRERLMSLVTKLQIKPGQRTRVVNAPPGFSLDAETSTGGDADAVLVFVRNSAELAEHEASALEQARADRLAWIAYPKAGQLDTDLNRDILWKLLDGEGVRPVRQVALDDTWSALRFRPG